MYIICTAGGCGGGCGVVVVVVAAAMCGRLKRCRTPRQKAPHPHTGTPVHACTRRIHAHTHVRARPAGRSPRAPVVPPSATKTSRLAAPAATGERRQHHSVANISIMFVCGFILLWCVCVCMRVYYIYNIHTLIRTQTQTTH